MAPVVGGEAVMLIVATGGATCFGAIAASLQDKVAQTAWNVVCMRLACSFCVYRLSRAVRITDPAGQTRALLLESLSLRSSAGCGLHSRNSDDGHDGYAVARSGTGWQSVRAALGYS